MPQLSGSLFLADAGLETDLVFNREIAPENSRPIRSCRASKAAPHFQKSRVLFNLNRIGDTEHITLVESYWSAIRLHTLGVPVAALMGWSVSPEQLALLRERGIRFVTLLLDGDDAGRRGCKRCQTWQRGSSCPLPCCRTARSPDTLDEELLLELVASPSA